MEHKIFVSYRRADSKAVAFLLAAELSRRFGKSSVFIDASRIAPGEVWPDRLSDAIATSDVVLVIIEESFASLPGRDLATPKIFEESDWLRREVREAIIQGKLLIPVLVNEAQLPSKRQLPADIQPLLERQAFRFHVGDSQDVEALGDFLAHEVTLSWEQFNAAIVKLAPDLVYRTDIIVGVGVGGAIVGATLAGNLNKPFLCLDREVSYDASRLRTTSLIGAEWSQAKRDLIRSKRVVVVSAEIVSGATTNLAMDLMRRFGAASVSTCCIYAYEERTVQADYFYRERRAGGVVQMPWRILPSYSNPDDVIRPAAVERESDE
jgi:hypoxanthine phosphoribosyltransferase